MVAMGRQGHHLEAIGMPADQVEGARTNRTRGAENGQSLSSGGFCGHGLLILDRRRVKEHRKGQHSQQRVKPVEEAAMAG